MIGISFHTYVEKAKYEEKGKPVDGHVILRSETVLRDKKGVVEVVAGEAAVVLRSLYQRFTSSAISLGKAMSIVKSL
jgi:hypothetical protein